ncbi:MAG: PEP/pyruvate-binding domain-containing protein [Deltaproteobacteria bacterium]
MTVSPSRCLPDKDAGFKIYQDLMPFKVRDILLVHTAYDAFVMEGDGTLASRIVTQYHGLNLSQPPRLSLATSAAEALRSIEGHFDLVITMPRVGDMDALSLAAAIKERKADLPVILISHGISPHFPEDRPDISPLDAYYVWTADPDLLLAIVKNLEDHKNAAQDTRRASVRVLLLVEDSPLYRSYFLPLLYNQVVRQTQAVLDESLNAEHRLMKMRARPKILTASTFESAVELFHRYQKYIFGVISDTRFPKEGRIDDTAGISLLESIHQHIAELPLLMLSSESANRRQAETIPAVFIDKNASDLSEQVSAFFLEHLGFGDFVFKDEESHSFDRAVNLIDFERKLRRIPEASLLYHARRNHFSNWIMARSEVRLADLCQRQALKQFDDPAKLRDYLCSIIHDELQKRQRGIVTQFSSRDFDAEIMEFVRCGRGAMGGKAQGLAFLSHYLRRTGGMCGIEGVRIAIPRTLVITTEAFDLFIEENNLPELFRQQQSDERINEIFVQGRLPAWLRQQLAVLLAQIDHPIIVRSSSVLEDAHFAPYAGLFRTVLLANDHPDARERLLQLEKAIKTVFASALHAGPRSFASKRRQHRPGSMAVMVQQLVGHRYGSFFYPALSGVAQSSNFYPLAPMQAEEGIAHIALGLGNTVVAGEQCLNFSPAHPRFLPQFSTVEDILENAQKTFYVLPLSDSGRKPDYAPLKRQLAEAMTEYPLQLFCSSYLAEDHRIRDSFGAGIPVLSFSNILKHDLIPLPRILQKLLNLCREGTGGEVEVEFCLDINDGSREPTFYILQLRPQATVLERQDVTITEAERNKALLFSREVLGHGRIDDITDILYVNQTTFRIETSRQIAREIGIFNAQLEKEGRPYILIGPGIHYITVDTRKKDTLNRILLEKLPVAAEKSFVRHIRLPNPLVIKTDNRSGQCVVYLQ